VRILIQRTNAIIDNLADLASDVRDTAEDLDLDLIRIEAVVDVAREGLKIARDRLAYEFTEAYKQERTEGD
jgi:hypothetical protein